MVKENIKVAISSRTVVNSPFTNGKCYKYIMKLTHNNKSMIYPFYDSIYNYERNIRVNKLETVSCILTDRRAYRFAFDFKDFCNEFGYDLDTEENIAKANRAYTGCKEMHDKLNELFTEDELDTLAEELEV